MSEQTETVKIQHLDGTVYTPIVSTGGTPLDSGVPGTIGASHITDGVFPELDVNIHSSGGANEISGGLKFIAVDAAGNESELNEFRCYYAGNLSPTGKSRFPDAQGNLEYGNSTDGRTVNFEVLFWLPDAGGISVLPGDVQSFKVECDQIGEGPDHVGQIETWPIEDGWEYQTGAASPFNLTLSSWAYGQIDNGYELTITNSGGFSHVEEPGLLYYFNKDFVVDTIILPANTEQSLVWKACWQDNGTVGEDTIGTNAYSFFCPTTNHDLLAPVEVNITSPGNFDVFASSSIVIVGTVDDTSGPA